MRFESIHITNYKGFDDTGRIPLHPHTNVLIGQNSAGKSAFLEAFDFSKGSVANMPHRTLRRPYFGGISTFLFEIVEHGSELVGFAVRTNTAFSLRIADGGGNGDQVSAKFRTSDVRLHGKWSPGQGGFQEPHLWIGNDALRLNNGAVVVLTPNPTQTEMINNTSGGAANVLPIYWTAAAAKVFTFKAERYRIGHSAIAPNPMLQADASNLAGCLADLRKNRRQYDTYVELVQSVLPQVADIGVAPYPGGGGNVEIQIYNAKTDDPRMGIPLNDCGTGVAQVMAILYVIHTYKSAVIVIDEPNTFLHPAATKCLMRIMRQRTNFQFVVTSHSAEVIAALGPEHVLDVRWNHENGHTQIISREARSLATKRALMSNLGISFADVFGSDKIIWTEGATEAACFDLLLDASDDARPQGLTFLAMPFASKSDQKNKSDVIEFFAVLTRVSEGAALWPSSTWFSFDPERRTSAQLTEIDKLSGDRTTFLPRRTYENYLLHPTALAALLARLDKDGVYSAETVEDWIAANKGTHRKGATTSADFDIEGDAASLLKAMFSALSETRAQYGKVEHGAWLTEWLLKNDKPFVRELIQHVADLAKSVEQA